MKTYYAVALAALSTLALAGPASADPASKRGGHYEWRAASQPGPSKSNLPNLRRVWVADAPPKHAMNHDQLEGCCAAMACCAQPLSQ